MSSAAAPGKGRLMQKRVQGTLKGRGSGVSASPVSAIQDLAQ
jgi:hypothetical protein